MSWLLPLSLIGAFVLVALGVLVTIGTPQMLKSIGHAEAALPAVMGGRYIGMGVILGGLALMRAWHPLVLVLLVYAGFGFFDAWVAPNVDGATAKHIGAGLLALVGAGVVMWFASRGAA
jgi:hypothetical protein